MSICYGLCIVGEPTGDPEVLDRSLPSDWTAVEEAKPTNINETETKYVQTEWVNKNVQKGGTSGAGRTGAVKGRRQSTGQDKGGWWEWTWYRKQWDSQTKKRARFMLKGPWQFLSLIWVYGKAKWVWTDPWIIIYLILSTHFPRT